MYIYIYIYREKDIMQKSSKSECAHKSLLPLYKKI